MPTRTYSRKNDGMGNPADPTKGDPSFSSGALTALPGRTWRVNASGSELFIYIDGDDLTPQEDADLTAAHTAWSPSCQCRFMEIYQVETMTDGKITKIEWYETDEGEGVYSGLARDEVWTWSLGKLVSTTAKTYQRDGTVSPNNVVTTTYYTTSDGKKVKKRSDT